MGVRKKCLKLFLQMEERYLTVDDKRKVASCLSDRLVLFLNGFRGLALCQ